MFFNRNKQQEEQSGRTGITDGLAPKVAEFVKNWGDLQRGSREFVADRQDPPLQLLTSADIAYFVEQMDAEMKRIEAEAAERRTAHLADIASKDAEIAALNRDIEATRARIAAQDDEVRRRVDQRHELLATARAMAPSLNTDKLTDSAIRREVVRLKFGDQAVTGRTEDYIEARFDILAVAKPADPFARVVADGLMPPAGAAGASDRAYAEMVASLADAHKTKH